MKKVTKKAAQAPRKRYGLNPEGKTVYVGNLLFDMDENSLFGLFGKFGKVKFVNIIREGKNNRSKGIAFVDMYEAKDADKAIAQLNGRVVAGRTLKVSAAIDNAKVKAKIKEKPLKEKAPTKTYGKNKEEIIAKKQKRRRSGLASLFSNTRK